MARFKIYRVIVLGLSAGFFAGCQSMPVADPLTEHHGGNDPESQMEFWHGLAERRVVSNDDAMHALLLFAEPEHDAASYDDRVARLKDAGWLAQGFDEPADTAARRGTVASVLTRVLQVRGGVMLTLFGPVERYALRELAYQRVMPNSSPMQVISGPELLDVIARAEDYQRAAIARSAPASPTPAESAPTQSNDETQTEGDDDAA